MNKELKELLDKEILTEEEMDHLVEHEDVLQIDRVGESSIHEGYKWYDVVYHNGELYLNADVYTK